MIPKRKQPWLYWTIAIAVFFAIAIILLPINGRVVITTADLPESDVWPRFGLEPSDQHDGEQYWITVHDIHPWSYVLLMSAAGPLARDETWATGNGPWRWRWLVPDDAALQRPLVFYHSCESGCRERGRTSFAANEPQPEPNRVATKLGLVFPSPTRDWHGRAGWAVELTYLMHQEDQDFSVDGLATRVASHTAQGLRVIVRIAYAREQSLPPVGDEVAMRDYLEYCRRLARDERLRDVFAYVIGSGLNNPNENRLSRSGPLTPAWYARLFNGYGLPASRHDNVVETMRTHRATVRLLVGPVTPWLTTIDGEIPSELDQPWLNFFHTTLTYLATSAETKSRAGIPGVAPDGFALHVPGRLDAMPRSLPAAQEPITDLAHPEWGKAQAGFRVYKDWLTTINLQPLFHGLPAYITATNTYAPGESGLPAQNYAPGWLTKAFDEVLAEPQIQAFCWFVDEPLGGVWTEFSLQNPVGRMHDAAAEFERLLQQP